MDMCEGWRMICGCICILLVLSLSVNVALLVLYVREARKSLPSAKIVDLPEKMGLTRKKKRAAKRKG